MNRINLGLGSPRYQQLAQAIADGIARGDYPVGSLLPGEEEIGRQFKFSRFTVREALRHLQEVGLVNRRQGIGTSVIASAPARRFAHTIGSIEQLQQYARDTRLVAPRFADVVADEEMAETLGCTLGQKFLRITALRAESDGPDATPVAWTRIHLAAVHAAGVRNAMAGHRGSVGALVEALSGEKISAIGQTISAVAISPEIAAELGVATGSPGLRIDRSYSGRNGVPFEYATAIHPSGRFSLSMELKGVSPD
jgi:GntR family transcriptional regulator